jgi:hypothetical protein
VIAAFRGRLETRFRDIDTTGAHPRLGARGPAHPKGRVKLWAGAAPQDQKIEGRAGWLREGEVAKQLDERSIPEEACIGSAAPRLYSTRSTMNMVSNRLDDSPRADSPRPMAPYELDRPIEESRGDCGILCTILNGSRNSLQCGEDRRHAAKPSPSGSTRETVIHLRSSSFPTPLTVEGPAELSSSGLSRGSEVTSKSHFLVMRICHHPSTVLIRGARSFLLLFTQAGCQLKYDSTSLRCCSVSIFAPRGRSDPPSRNERARPGLLIRRRSSAWRARVSARGPTLE